MEWVYFAGGVAVGVVLTLILKGLFKPVVTRHQYGPSMPPPPPRAHTPAPAPATRGEVTSGRYSVILKSGGPNKILVIKAIREVNGSGLKEAKDCVDLAPRVVAQNLSRDAAERAMRALIAAGAEVEIR